MLDNFFMGILFLLTVTLFSAVGYMIYEESTVLNTFEAGVSESFKNNRIISNNEKSDLGKTLYSMGHIDENNIQSYIKNGYNENENSKFLILSLKNLDVSNCRSSTSSLIGNVNEILINNILFLSPNDERVIKANDWQLLTFEDIYNFCKVKSNNNVIFIKYLNN